MERPFVFMTIPLIFGIIFAYYFNFDMLLIIIFIILSIFAYILNLIKGKSNSWILFFICLFLGAIINNYNLNSSELNSKADKNLVLNGIVDEVVWEEEDQGKYIIIINSIEENLLQRTVKEKTVLKVLGNTKLEMGDKIRFSGVLKIPLENTNPNLFNYRLSLLSNKIYTSITINDYSIINIENTNKAFKYKLKSKFREHVESVFDNNLSIDNSSLMKSIILGEYSYLDEENISKYRELGLAHILAVSGLHIGIIAGFLIYILSHLGVKRKANVIISLSIIWFYGYLIGFPPSLLRANIMFSILFYAQILAEPYDSINSLFLAMFVLLLFNPMWIFNLGFQLSFLATFSIIYITPRFQELFYPYKNKVTYSLSGLLAVQIGLLPIQAYYFNNISVISIISNLIIAPILSLALIIGGIMVGLSHLIPSLNSIPGLILDLILSVNFYLVDFLYSIPFGVIKIFSPSIWEIILYYIFILIVFKVIKVRKLHLNIKKVIIYYLILMTIWSSVTLMNHKSIELHFVDVGQGDCILIRTLKGDYLIDTGGSILDSFDVGESITLPYLQKLGVSKLKGVFITHFDADHCGALPLLIENLNIENILISYEDRDNEVYNEIKDSGVAITILKEKDKLFLDDNTLIEVLNPNKDLFNRGEVSNNLSLAFLLSYYNKQILFTGDIEKEAELEIVDKFKSNIDIIKIPHHGSNTSSSEEFLNKIKPQIGIISVGRNNFYGHPGKDVLDRYEELGTKIYRTDTMGMIKLELNKDEISLTSFVNEDLRLIQFLDENLLNVIFYISFCLFSYILSKHYLYKEGEL
ncbi:DNA internalization-related competence protein ComEC/Rec2 [Tissierella sp.]|uniref:DNA internalization-related competence protein ComEC/Rec2 n=1 Tax=Tissierella sp. TaxID=41274 RepID=UPI00285F11CB|nr:DNA internalization-related competence protein ComEC/Rec2 [Tissierella sp.]MDR7857096.1 DNA internalization-related competence protein ComEC/Rec2 [Tissierella sp.]